MDFKSLIEEAISTVSADLNLTDPTPAPTPEPEVSPAEPEPTPVAEPDPEPEPTPAEPEPTEPPAEPTEPEPIDYSKITLINEPEVPTDPFEVFKKAYGFKSDDEMKNTLTDMALRAQLQNTQADVPPELQDQFLAMYKEIQTLKAKQSIDESKYRTTAVNDKIRKLAEQYGLNQEDINTFNSNMQEKKINVVDNLDRLDILLRGDMYETIKTREQEKLVRDKQTRANTTPLRTNVGARQTNTVADDTKLSAEVDELAKNIAKRFGR